MDDAVESFGLALALEPQMARARYYRGMALNKLNRYGAAVEDLQRAAKALADDGRVHYQLGIAYDGLSLKSEARASYRRARTLAG
jgi:Flp pilus assembly protein TadD